MIFRHVVLAQPATECWWWNVWKPDKTDRRALFTQFRTRMLHNIQHQTEGPSPPDLVLILQRPAHTDRRLLNEAELAEGLTANLSSLGLRVDLKDLGQMSTQQQMTLISSVAVLIGMHGAGLVWNLFLPEGSLLVRHRRPSSCVVPGNDLPGTTCWLTAPLVCNTGGAA